MYLPRNLAFDGIKQEACFSVNWRSETKVLGFQKRHFFGKSSYTSTVFILSEDGAKRLVQNYSNDKLCKHVYIRRVLRKQDSHSRRRTLTTLQTPSILNPVEVDEKRGDTSIPFPENSYKMILDATFNFEQARRLAEDVLHRNFKAWNARRKNAKNLC